MKGGRKGLEEGGKEKELRLLGGRAPIQIHQAIYSTQAMPFLCELLFPL